MGDHEGVVEWVVKGDYEKLGNSGAERVVRLLDTLSTCDSEARDALEEALVSIGSSAIPTLVQCLQDTPEDVYQMAAKTLVKIGLQAAKELLRTPTPYSPSIPP